jgi:hypothetical protein
MPDFCSCGSELPPDALFCHKCGKPQRELTEVAVEPQAPVPIVVVVQQGPPPPAAPLDFRNPLALKIALMVAMGAAALFWVLPFVNWLAAGYFAVFFYRRRTGCAINVGVGVRLGWITGLFTFPTAGVSVLYLINAASSLPQVLSEPHSRELLAMLRSSPGAAVVILLLEVFILSTCLCMAGGVLAALAGKLGQVRPPRGGSNA